ncbi:MAG: hypothetical protein LBE13_12500 [Bacteroidales bacterium]|jgi:hypothetical protein|nr:hypothetical protein [Bacteroidales bacterium]
MPEINKSLLECITSQEVDDLIFEYELSLDEYKFHYFIDTNDINKYSFPFGFVANSNFDERDKRPIEVITDEQISYHYLINNREECLLLFDEHKEELINFVNKIERVKNIGLQIVDAFQRQADLFDKTSRGQFITFDNWKENQKLLSEFNVSALISIALGSLSDGEERLQKLMKDKLCYDKAEQLPQGVDKNIFSSSQPSGITEKLFEQLCISYYKNVADDLGRLIARYKKCVVYDRLLNLNYISKNSRHLFLLISSGKTTNERLPKIAGEAGLNINVNEKNFNPTRSVNQIYLKLLLDNTNNTSNEDKIKELEQIRKLVCTKENELSKKEEINELLRKYRKGLEDFGEGYENISLLLSNFYKENFFREALTNRHITDPSNLNIANSISELLKISQDTGTLQKLRRSYVYDISISKNYNTVLQQATSKISSGDRTFNTYSGNDHVTNIYNALPLVFFKEGNEDFKKIIREIAEYVRRLPIDNDNGGSQKIIQSINESFSLLFYKVVPNEEEKIIMLIIFLMLNIGTDKHPESNDAAYHLIKEMLEVKPIDKSWMPAFRYIESWIARRVKEYQQSINIAKRELEIDDKDPRFYHSIHLSYYCFYKDEKDNDKKLDYLTLSIENCQKAYVLYRKKNAEINSESINLAYIAILNGIAYLNTLIYEMKTEPENLRLAREYLNELKCQDTNYFKQAEFAHTEAFLLKTEYLASNNRDVEKLDLAGQAIERAINLRLMPKPDYQTLKNEIEKLRFRKEQ